MKTLRSVSVLTSITVTTTILAFATSEAVAQTVADSGQRVRVTQVSGARITGVLLRVSRDSLTVRDAARQRGHVIPRADIIRLERSLGQRRDFWGGFLTTIVVASVGLGAIAAISWTPCNSNEAFGCLLYPESRTDAFAVGALAGAVLGVPVGAIVGAKRQSEHWLIVAAADVRGSDVRFAIAPLRDGIKVRLAF